VPYEITQVPGSIRDFDGERILFSTGYSLMIRSLAGGPDTVVAEHGVGTAFLTSRGAIWVGGEWRDGMTLTNTATSNLVARGNYAGWTSIGADPSPKPIFAYWRDVAADVTVQIADGGYETRDPAVAANGDMIFTWAAPGVASFQIYRYRAGAAAKLSAVTCPTCIAPAATDGINVLYMRRPDPTPPYDRPSSHLVLPSGQTVNLDPGASGPLPQEYQPQSYALAGGWTGFTMLTGGVPMAHLRSPCGVITRLGILNAQHAIHAISENGEVVFSVGGSTYIVGPSGGAPAPFALTGKILYRNGWYSIDNYRLLHDPNASPDAGATDAGAGPCIVDAGSEGGVLDSGGSGDASVDGGSDAGSALDGGQGDVSIDQGTSGDSSSDTTRDDGGLQDASTRRDAGITDVASDAYRNDALVSDARQEDTSSDGSEILDARNDTRLSLDADSGRIGDVQDVGVDTDPSGDDTGCSACSISGRHRDGKLAFGLALGLAGISMLRKRRGRPIHAVGRRCIRVVSRGEARHESTTL
jgi:hypothetical protein